MRARFNLAPSPARFLLSSSCSRWLAGQLPAAFALLAAPLAFAQAAPQMPPASAMPKILCHPCGEVPPPPGYTCAQDVMVNSTVRTADIEKLKAEICPATPPPSKTTTSFCEDLEPLSTLKAGSVPSAVVRAVTNTRVVRQARTHADRSKTELDPEKLLRAIKLDLAGTPLNLFLVVGSYPLSAADGAWFWIVRANGPTASVLLSTAGNCVNVLPSRAKGYPDFEVKWASAGSARTTIFRYEGKTYQQIRSHLTQK